MAKEPSSISDNTTSPSPSSTADSYIGSFITVTSKCEIRYEGVLYYLNPQDSTFGLKDVKSYGTEGRNKNGQQVPPSDKVYEYILFHGSDIKDLQVITAPPVQIEEPIYNDPAIIQSNSYMRPPSSSKSVPAIVGSLAEHNTCTEPSASTTRFFQNISPSHHSGVQSGFRGSCQSAQDAASSYSMPTQRQGFNGPPNLSNNISRGHSIASSSPIYLAATSTLSSEQLSTPFTDSVSSKPSPLPFHHSTLINSNGLTMPFSLTYQNASSIGAQAANEVAPNPASLKSFQSSPNIVFDPSSDLQQQVFPTPDLSQPKLSEISRAKTLYPDHKDSGVMSSNALNFSSSAAPPAVQPPLLPLPPPSQKFTEEFDFQAMNEKFKKDEVWGYLGKVNQREKTEGIQENGTSTLELGDDNPEMTYKNDPKASSEDYVTLPAYNKDDFFDTISCNSFGLGARNGQNQFSERMKLDSQTFGNSERSYQYGYGGHRDGRGERGYNYNNRGHGGYMQR
ncbi:hypothetical protein OROGR_005770 [Orobanche gracilis]